MSGQNDHFTSDAAPLASKDHSFESYAAFTSAARPNLVVCEFCDSVYRRRSLAHRQIAHCTLCGAHLYWSTRLDIDHLLALTVTTGVVFAIANTSPVIRISAQGLHSETTLLQSVLALSKGPSIVVGLVAAATLFAVPFLQITLLGWVLLFARHRLRAPGFGVAMRVMHAIHPWSMTEVFLLGVLVAIVKLSGMLQVIPGPGTYATVALTFLITLIAKRDLRSLWAWLPEQPRRSL